MSIEFENKFCIKYAIPYATNYPVNKFTITSNKLNVLFLMILMSLVMPNQSEIRKVVALGKSFEIFQPLYHFSYDPNIRFCLRVLFRKECYGCPLLRHRYIFLLNSDVKYRR